MRLLLGEMFPSAAARHLREKFGYDAVHVDDLGLRGAADPQVASVARSESRAVVTENVADYAREPDLVLVCVLERNLPTGGGHPQALAELLDAWCRSNPTPYVGQHWPT